MQTLERITDGTACNVYHSGNRAELPSRDGQEEKDYGAERCRNYFLNTAFSSITPGFLIKDGDAGASNILTGENYEYLLASYLRYAELSGAKASHIPGKNVGESISQLVYDMDTLLRGNVGVNLEYDGSRLYFNLWKQHTWGEYTLYYFPLKFVEKLPASLRRICLSFIHCMARDNGIRTVLGEEDMECILDWLGDADWDEPEKDTRKRLRTVSSYREGKACKLLKRIEKKPRCKNLPEAIGSYVPRNGWERELVELLEEGLQFLCPEKPIMHYEYDPYYEEDPEYYPMGLDRQIRIIYDNDDIVAEYLIQQYNADHQETYDLVPITEMVLSPETDSLFKMEDDYPERFFRWSDKFIYHTSIHQN